jgi:prevent-host-death family protein
MSTVGVRELRQNASEVIRRVEGGEEIDVTVNGRVAARLVPIRGRARTRTIKGAELAARLAELPPDETGWAEQWNRSRDDDPLVDPWAER